LGFEFATNLQTHYVRYHTVVDDPERIAMNETHNARQRERYANDEDYRITMQMRSALQHILKRAGLAKESRTEALIGCNYKELITHVNNNDRGFVFGDSETFGKLEVDHVRPWKDLIKGCQVDFRRISNFNNLQLLPWRENNTKRDKFTSEDKAQYAQKQGKVIEDLVPGWITAGVCNCVRCVCV
jgi:hypothetical protein